MAQQQRGYTERGDGEGFLPWGKPTTHYALGATRGAEGTTLRHAWLHGGGGNHPHTAFEDEAVAA